MIFGLAAAIAFGMSLQFLAQLFVWRNWPAGEVLEGWLYVFRDRLIVAVSIAMAIALLGVLRARSLRLRSALLALSVLSGAIVGEALLRALYGIHNGAALLLTHALRWSAVALAVATSYHLWRASDESREALRRESLRRQYAERQLITTRLTALRKQIEPHFLFNTLATVRRLHRTESTEGALMLASFIDYLRRLMPMLHSSEVPLADELQLVRAYLSVIEIRMSGRLRVRIDAASELQSALVPPLALATLVENAVKHGLAPSPSGGEIFISASEQGGVLELTVTDTGVGFKTNVGGGTGIGLSNVRARLATLHGAAASLNVQANSPAGVRATMRLPRRPGS